jgi:poly(A) polymerase
VLVKRGEDQFEVATFRREPKPEERTEEEHPLADNIFGSPEEDAKRRDFTINGLFYDPIEDKIIDYVDGLSDIKNRVLRMIGNPTERLIEDPIRILRGLRLASKLRFTIEPELRAAMIAQAPELLKSVLPRRREEMIKILRLRDPGRVLLEAHDLQILKYCWPHLDEVFCDEEKKEVFLRYLDRIGDWVENENSPTELFSILILAYVVATGIVTFPLEIRKGDLSQSNKLKELMKDQLGMFIAEMSEICTAIEITSRLGDIESFGRRGARRQASFVRQQGFGLAIKIAELEHLVPPSQIKKWLGKTGTQQG